MTDSQAAGSGVAGNTAATKWSAEVKAELETAVQGSDLTESDSYWLTIDETNLSEEQIFNRFRWSCARCDSVSG